MSNRSGNSHSYTPSNGTTYSEDVGSTATTLLGSPRSTSGEYESKLHDGRRDRGFWANDSNSEDEDDGNEEPHEPLLSVEDRAKQLGKVPLISPEEAAVASVPLTAPEKPKPVSWSQLPRKDQLLILVLARLSEPLTQTSLQSYMFYQLKSFTLPSGETPSDGTVARQAGLITAAFTGAQFCTAILWGRLADSELMGRKRVVLVGLTGTAIMSLGFGFSQSFASVMFWRCLGGLLNGNIGVMKTLVSEIVREKRYQSRAFLLLPMCFNIGVIVGPLLGGLLADPVSAYPSIFGPGSSLGGRDGVKWMKSYPYALPNVVNACVLSGSAIVVILGLEETLEGLRHRPDYGIRLRQWLLRKIFRQRQQLRYDPVSDHELPLDDLESTPTSKRGARKRESYTKKRRKLPFRRIWTRNLLIMLLSHGLLACHVSMFNSLWFVFLSTPRYDPQYVPGSKSEELLSANATHPPPLQHLPPGYKPHPPFSFTGGLALPPRTVGTVLATLGTIGICLQFLLYPRVSFRLGPLFSLRIFTWCFPIAYALAPFLVLLPSSTSPPFPASGPILWLGIAFVLSILMLARTFVQPSTTILVNNSSPHPSVLGTVHGIAQSVGSATKTVGPAIGGWIYSVALTSGVVGLAWWVIAIVAVVGAIVGQFLWEGDGHEIWLEGEREELEELERERERERAESASIQPGGGGSRRSTES